MSKKKWLWLAPCLAIATLVAVPSVARAFKIWEIQQRQAKVSSARAALAAGADGLPMLAGLLNDPNADSAAPETEEDDAEVRRLVLQAEIGPRTGESQAMLLQIAASERAKWSNANAPALGGPGIGPGTRTWFNLGPQAARNEFNGTYYKAMDSGRPNTVAVHPTKPNTVFLATSGGGVWRADDFGNFPTWVPITDTLGSLAIGAMSLSSTVDATSGEPTVFLGLGDFVDQPIGAVVKSADGGATWSAPVSLRTAAHPVDNLPSSATNVRDIKVDPNDSNVIFAATDDGFYRSTDGGASFNLVDLPNAGPVQVRENGWQIVYTGQAVDPTSGLPVSQWMVSGVYACPNANPPAIQTGTFACPAPNQAVFNRGDFWKSTDGGATWTSIRAAGGLPASVTGSIATEIGRINFAAAVQADPATTVLYAEASAAQETTVSISATQTFANATAAFLKSVDGGNTWTRIATGLSLNNVLGATVAPTALTNPTFSTEANSGCQTMNLAHVQSWYNLTVAVDPGNPNRAIFGGDLCSAITKDGGTTFQAASHWLPQSGAGFTADGFLPYVHADWHATLAIRDGAGQSVLFAGSDGGLFVTRNIWDTPNPTLAQWQQPDVGLATHLFYGIGTGDPTLGNPNVVFGGLQDNGTRWRLIADENFIQEFNIQNWDQILGGDGFGAAVTTDTTGQNPVYWISVNGSRRYCRPRAHDCSLATRIENGVELANWRNPGSFGDPAGDPFIMRYSPLGDDTSGVLTATSTMGFKLFVSTGDLPAITLMTPAVSVVNGALAGGIRVDGSIRTIRGMGFRGSPYRYTIDGVPGSRVYGGVMTSSTTGLGSFVTIDEPGKAPQTFPAIHGVQVKDAACASTAGTCFIGNGSDWAAPQNPAGLGGTDSKATWLVASNSVLTNPVGGPATLIPASVGHLFKTTDQGATWVPFHGNGTGFDLPNVPVYVIKYDPTDTTDQSIWVGTDLGVYRTTDGGNTWAPYGLGLPMVRVWDINFANNGSLVRVATYGRGIWEIYPNSEPATAPANGDFDKNGVIDFFDMASLAARMGSVPATQPGFVGDVLYDNLVDLDPTIPAGKTTTTIDETDLAALVAKFGSAP